ncbi:MAG: CYTH domain-containing protein [Flavobacteriaceae bacterium]
MLEIERKFLVDDLTNCLKEAKASFSIFQGYLSNDPARTVRLRIRNKQAFLTLKGASSDDGTTRVEWEKEISIEDAKALLPLCLPDSIQKTRYHVSYKQNLFEVDVFEKNLEGLVIAEVELKNANQEIELPDWIGKEVTGDKRYYNSYMATHGIPD